MPGKKPYKLDRVAIRMVKEPPLYSAEPVTSPETAIRVLADAIRDYDRELVCLVNLQADMKPINMNICSMGALNYAVVSPREVLKSAVLSNASNVIMVHNHPSGNLQPSTEDIMITDRMQKAFAIMDIKLMDHIIIGRDDRYFSFRENSVMPEAEMHYAKDMSEIDLIHPEKVKESVLGKLSEAKKEYTARPDIKSKEKGGEAL